MFCYFPGTTVAGIALGALLWWAHRVIFAIVVLVLRLGEFAGIALLATAALAVATLIVGFIEWTARLIRARQAARGACLTCPHPCQQAQVIPAGQLRKLGAVLPTQLSWPEGQTTERTIAP